jgi:hypothetical protein
MGCTGPAYTAIANPLEGVFAIWLPILFAIPPILLCVFSGLPYTGQPIPLGKSMEWPVWGFGMPGTGLGTNSDTWLVRKTDHPQYPRHT